MSTIKKEASTVVGSLKGFSAPFGSVPAKKKDKKNPNKPFGEDELFESSVISRAFDEAVRQRPDKQWAVYDDNTGAQLSVHKKRGDAWKKQRQVRASKESQKKAKSAERKRQTRSLSPDIAKPMAKKKKDRPKLAKAKPRKQSDQPHKAKGAKTAGGAKYQKTRATRTEQMIRNALHSVLKEASMVSYIFENPPLKGSAWDHFVERLSNETMLSDANLKKVLENIVKSEMRMLGRAVESISEVLSGTEMFEVCKGKMYRDEKNELRMNFEVAIKENGKKLGFSVGVQNARPLIIFPEQSRTSINEMGTKASKLLRAELMHVQETALDAMDDLIKATKARDNYLSLMEKKLCKALSSMGPMQIAMLKYLLKKNYKSIK